MPRWAAVGSVLVVSGLLLSACSSSAGSAADRAGGSSSSGGAVVSPSAARAVVRRTMATNNTANAELNGRLLATYEAGSAFALDDASYRGDRAARFRPPNSPFTVDISAVAVARRASWPARFLAVGTQRSLLPKAPAGPSCDALLYFERQSAGGRWRLFLEPTVNASASPRPATGAGGFAAPV
ncbi:MAG TPA: hypothetical protein VFN50_05380, partial [Acidimicrobiales bacterium]|nr:hypothetical protein [Acidimicrobiales bacterium]